MREAAEFSQCHQGIVHREQGLYEVDRQFAKRLQERANRAVSGGESGAPFRAAGMKIPGCREKRETADMVGAPERGCERQQPAHAVADQNRLFPGQPPKFVDRRCQPFLDIEPISKRRSKSPGDPHSIR